MASPWWNRKGLEALDGRLQVIGRDAETLAREHGTPLYVFDASRMEIKLRNLQSALERAGVRHRVLYAFKANRQPAILARLREMEDVGIDILAMLNAGGYGPSMASEHCSRPHAGCLVLST